MLTNTLRGNNTMVNTTTKEAAMVSIEVIDIYQQQIQELDDMMFCLWNVRDIARAIARRDELEEIVACLRKQARN